MCAGEEKSFRKDIRIEATSLGSSNFREHEILRDEELESCRHMRESFRERVGDDTSRMAEVA